MLQSVQKWPHGYPVATDLLKRRCFEEHIGMHHECSETNAFRMGQCLQVCLCWRCKDSKMNTICASFFVCWFVCLYLMKATKHSKPRLFVTKVQSIQVWNLPHIQDFEARLHVCLRWNCQLFKKGSMVACLCVWWRCKAFNIWKMLVHIVCLCNSCQALEAHSFVMNASKHLRWEASLHVWMTRASHVHHALRQRDDHCLHLESLHGFVEPAPSTLTSTASQLANSKLSRPGHGS